MYVYFPEQNVLAVGDAVPGQGWPSSTGGPAAGLAASSAGSQRFRRWPTTDTRIVPARGPVLSTRICKHSTRCTATIYDRLVKLLNRGRGPERGRGRASRRKEFDAQMGQSGRVRAARVREPVGLSVAGRVSDATRTMKRTSIDRRCCRPRCAALALLAGCGLLAACNPFAEPTRRRARTRAVAARQAVLRRLPQRRRARRRAVGFERLTPESIAQHAEVFEKAVRKLRGRVMPPPRSRSPTRQRLDSLVAWLETRSTRRPAGARAPDAIVLHRLNRKEYANAVRDLLGGRLRRRRGAAAGRRGRGLRQHRDGAAGVAVVHRAVRRSRRAPSP